MTAAGFTDRTVHVNGLRFHYTERHDDQVHVSYGIEVTTLVQARRVTLLEQPA